MSFINHNNSNYRGEIMRNSVILIKEPLCETFWQVICLNLNHDLSVIHIVEPD